MLFNVFNAIKSTCESRNACDCLDRAHVRIKGRAIANEDADTELNSNRLGKHKMCHANYQVSFFAIDVLYSALLFSRRGGFQMGDAVWRMYEGSER